MFTAKSLLLKIFGTVTAGLGFLYFLFPQVFVSLVGLDTLYEMSPEYLDFIIRFAAIYIVVTGLAMLIVRGSFATHFWLWLFVMAAFALAIAALFLPGEELRQLAPLWISAIGILFFVGLAYGLDLAGVFAGEEEADVAEVLPKELVEVDGPSQAEEIKIVYSGEEESPS